MDSPDFPRAEKQEKLADCELPPSPLKQQMIYSEALLASNEIKIPQ